MKQPFFYSFVTMVLLLCLHFYLDHLPVVFAAPVAAVVLVAAVAVVAECNNKKERHDLTEKDRQRLLLTRFH